MPNLTYLYVWRLPDFFPGVLSAWSNLWSGIGCATCPACTPTTPTASTTGWCAASLARPAWSRWTRPSWSPTRPTDQLPRVQISAEKKRKVIARNEKKQDSSDWFLTWVLFCLVSNICEWQDFVFEADGANSSLTSTHSGKNLKFGLVFGIFFFCWWWCRLIIVKKEKN